MKFTTLFVALVAVPSTSAFAFTNVGPRTKSSSALRMAAEENTSTKEIKVGVIGCGRIGLVHLGAINKAPNVKPVIVSNPTVSKAEKAAADFNVARFSADAMDVITDPEVDAVWICSPSQFHAEQIKACAANNKHVFCEKPIATDLPETVEAINACNEAGIKLMIGLQRRFDDNFRRVRDAVEAKEVGENIMVRHCQLFLCMTKGKYTLIRHLFLPWLFSSILFNFCCFFFFLITVLTIAFPLPM